MLACTGIFVTEAGFRWPGYLSKSLDLKFEDVPGGALDSYAAVPALGWLQIVAFIIILELGYGATPPGNAPGDVGGPTWIRYDDPEVGRCRQRLCISWLKSQRISCTKLRPPTTCSGTLPLMKKVHTMAASLGSCVYGSLPARKMVL